MKDDNIKKGVLFLILSLLLVLSFWVLKPIIFSLILGILLAFLFSSSLDKAQKIFKSRTLTAVIFSIGLLFILFVVLFFSIPPLVNQSIKLYQISQTDNFLSPLINLFPNTPFYKSLAPTIYSFVAKIGSSLVNALSSLIYDFPTLLLQFTIVLLTFFFVLRDKEEFVDYTYNLLPFSDSINKRFFKSSKDITLSILYGQVFVGIIQGIIMGVGFFIAGAGYVLPLTFLSIFFGILPIIGTMIVWVPVIFYLLMKGKILSSIIVFIFGLISSNIDYPLRAEFVSRRIKMHTGIVLTGMIGGFLSFGILGLILGPLILSYLLILLEIYQDKKKIK